GGTTENYHPSSGGYAPATVDWQAENADSGANLGTRLANVGATWDKGGYKVDSTTATFNRAAAPDGPYGSLQLGVRLVDPDGPALGGLDMNAATSGACAPSSCTARTIGAPISVRFGVLRLDNAYGSELLPIRVPVRALYCNAATAGNCTDWRTNTDDTCTNPAANTLQIGSVTRPVGSSLAFSTPPTGVTVTQPPGQPGQWVVTITPATRGVGSADVRFNLGGVVTTTGCPTTLTGPVGGAAPPSAIDYLAGNWCGSTYDKSATARLRFGSPRAPYIYLRERY
ncbi:MAG: hypothetical protein Q7U97_04770, partial [Rhodocyclaceae bacterium]|nr:hypothetical protein [Rhodocyclaceae bacterium]